MIKWFYKYGFVLLLLNTILYSINETKDFIAPIIFYFLMSTGFLLLLINPIQIKEVIFHKSFLFLLFLNVINLIYFIFFENEFNQQSLEFLLARFVQFSLISLAIYYNYDYYKHKFISLLIKVITFIVILGLIFNPDLFEGRYNGIIWNPNMLSSLVVLSFSFVLLKENKKTPVEIVLLLLFFIISISTGSRLSLLIISLVFLYKFGFSFSNILYAIAGFSLLIFISTTNLDTSFNRVSSQGFLNDRTEQFSFAVENLKKKIWFGYGLSEYSGFPKTIKIPKIYEGLIMSSHNGYLSILLQYGVIFGFLVIFIIIRKSLLLLLYFLNKSQQKKIYFFIIFITLIAALFESLLTGINEFHTLLFWFSLSYLSYSYHMKYEN